MIEVPVSRASVARCLCLGALTLAAAGCSGATEETGLPPGGPLAAGLALLPDDPELHRHVLVSDLARLRRAYPEPGALQASLVGVWLPDALVGANRAQWHGAFGLRLDEVTSFASAGFHPAEVTVALGGFAPTSMRMVCRRSGYRMRGGVLEHGADGSIDATTETGRLALSSLNRVVGAPGPRGGGATTGGAQAARSPLRTLAEVQDFAAVADALDPITSAIVLEASLVRPPSGVPVSTRPRHSARLVGVGVDDTGPRSKVLKIALVYANRDDARSDAALIEDELGSTPLAGAPTTRFSDIASDWQVATDDRTIVVMGLLPPEQDSGTWRLLVERGDLAPLVRPEG